MLSIAESEIIQAVTHVPILAPIIIADDCEKFKNSASAKPIRLTVTADELCISAVIPVPKAIPFKLLSDTFKRRFFILSPDKFLSPVSITFIPNRKKLNPPINPNISNNICP